MQRSSIPTALRHRIALPEPSVTYNQDAEWLVIEMEDGWREIRFHDYADIYGVPGLYEQLFYDILKCDSPRFMSDLLGSALDGTDTDPRRLRVLDLGAGNGIMGEELRKLGVDFVVGADILAEAAAAAVRDRPDIYRDYHVADMTELSHEVAETMRDYKFNALTCIAALGFGDIPPECFRTAYNLVADRGWVAFTIKEGFLSEEDRSGFSTLIRDAVRNGDFEVGGSKVYQHRLATNGAPLHYTGIVGRKMADLP